METSRQTGQASRLGGKRPALARACAALGLMPLIQAARSAVRGDLRILAYHRVLDIDDAAFSFDLDLVSASSAQFRSQMEHVRRRYHPMRFHDVLECLAHGRRLPKNAAIVTFDDGYDDNYRVAFPILRSLGVPATFFVSTGHIDTGRAYAYDWLVHMVRMTPARQVDLPELHLELALPPDRRARAAIAADLLDRLKWLDDDAQGALVARLEREWSMPRAPDADCRPMTWDQLREMHAAGMEIGSHGVHHRMLARLRHDDMVGEVAESRLALERELGVAPEALSYPVGGRNAYSDEVIAALKAHGFAIGCTYISGSNRLPLADAYTLRRLPVERYTDQAWFCGTLAWPELFSHRSRQRS